MEEAAIRVETLTMLEEESGSAERTTVTSVELSARAEGMSTCSAALSGSSVAIAPKVASGASNTRSITLSAVVHKESSSANRPIRRI